DWTAEGEAIAREDALLEPDSLVRWGRRLGVLAGGEADAPVLDAARALRPALRAVLIAAGHAEAPREADLDLVMRTSPHPVPAPVRRPYAEAAAARRLSPADDGAYVLDWADEDPRKVRFAVTADAIALLRDPARVKRVHLCPGRDCGWLFLNKSGRQRWCSMDT